MNDADSTVQRPRLCGALGEAIREARADRDWSQEALADLVGIDRTYISGIERGVRNPTLVVIWRFADALGMAPDELLRRARLRLEADEEEVRDALPR